MLTRSSFLVASLALTLAACGTRYASPSDVPSDEVIEGSYKGWKHELAQNPNYHFDILIPKEWKVLQTTVAAKPEGEKPLEIALFREPGAWMEDESLSADGEILVEVFTTSGSLNAGGAKTEAPARWLKKKLDGGVGSYKVLEERSFVGPYGPVADLLVRTGRSSDYVVSRFSAFHSPLNDDEIFVIASSAPASTYDRVAEAFLTAVDSFRLTKAGTGSAL